MDFEKPYYLRTDPVMTSLDRYLKEQDKYEALAEWIEKQEEMAIKDRKNPARWRLMVERSMSRQIRVLNEKEQKKLKEIREWLNNWRTEIASNESEY
jgi:hypothetical protein